MDTPSATPQLDQDTGSPSPIDDELLTSLATGGEASSLDA